MAGQKDEFADIDITTRAGLPVELLFLLDSYPRDLWRKHENMDGLIRFWLGRHSDFRRVMTALNERNSDFLEGRMSPSDFASTLVPSFNMLLGALGQHHTVEDHHYFPKFRAVEPKLERGFDILDNDHHAIHATMDELAESANRFMGSRDRDHGLKNGEAFVASNERLMAFLMRHLADEEDLIVPLLLDTDVSFE